MGGWGKRDPRGTACLAAWPVVPGAPWLGLQPYQQRMLFTFSPRIRKTPLPHPLTAAGAACRRRRSASTGRKRRTNTRRRRRNTTSRRGSDRELLQARGLRTRGVAVPATAPIPRRTISGAGQVPELVEEPGTGASHRHSLHPAHRCNPAPVGDAGAGPGDSRPGLRLAASVGPRPALRAQA